MLQIFYNELGVWSLGFLTTTDQIIYFGSEKAAATDVKSEVISFSQSSQNFFGLEAYLTSAERTLASLGAVKVENSCLTNFKETMGDEFKWVVEKADGTIEVNGQTYFVDELEQEVQAEKVETQDVSDQEMNIDEETKTIEDTTTEDTNDSSVR